MRWRKTLDIYVAAPALAAAHPVEAISFPDKPGIVKGTRAADHGLHQGRAGAAAARPATRPACSGTLTGVLVLKSSDGSIQALNVDAPAGPVPDAFGGSAPAMQRRGITLCAGAAVRLSSAG